jgi:nucleoside-diphosphate-sugar epimerase
MPSEKLVLITGAAGNVGQTVFAGLKPFLKLRALDLRPTPGAHDEVVGNIADRAVVDRAVAGADTIVHFGGCPSMQADFLRDLVKPNIEGLWHMLDAARLAGVKRFVFASSTNVAFGATERARLTPDTVHVLNPYGATKAFGEVLGRWFHETYGMEFLAVRIGYFRGLYADPGLAEPWLHRIWLGPRDCVRFFRLAVEAPNFGYGIAYACSRCPEDYLDLTSARELIGYEPEETVPEA